MLDKTSLEEQASLIASGLVDGHIKDLATPDLHTLLAWEYWMDGAEDDEFIEEVWHSPDTDSTWTRDNVTDILITVFGFKE